MAVREAGPEDRRALWEWRNNPVTLKLFNIDRSVSYSDHCAWFDRYLADDARTIMIGVVDTVRVGAVYFNPATDGDHEMVAYLKPVYCGKGWLSSMIMAAVAFITERDGGVKIYADNQHDRGTVARLFESADFALSDGHRYRSRT